VAVIPDGRSAVSASADQTLKVWELESGRALRALQGHAASVNSESTIHRLGSDRAKAGLGYLLDPRC
jgi:WD40 repeat protein